MILLGEDNPDLLEFLLPRLREEGYKVLVARNGPDVLRLACEANLRAIVIEIDLPQMPGDEVVRRLREKPELARIPVVFLAAEIGPRLHDLLVENHVVCLEKAIKCQTLFEMLQLLIG